MLSKKIAKISQTSKNKAFLKNEGGFSALLDLKKLKFNDPILLSSTDGVGTKLKIAVEYSYYKNLGIDLVAMCVNDLLVNGGKPIFFLDYISTSKLLENQFLKIIKSINLGCIEADCSLVGGETAEMPNVYSKNEFDMAGFAVGIVERKNLVTKANVKEGCIILGLESNGFHSNGFSLIRNILSKKFKTLDFKTPYRSNYKLLYKDLLAPTKIYSRLILPLVYEKLITSMAHITGGGLIENIGRALPKNYFAEIYIKQFCLPDRYQWLSKIGKISSNEMINTFNCGIGFVIIIEKKNQKKVLDYFKQLKVNCYEMGRVSKGKHKHKVEIKKITPWI